MTRGPVSRASSILFLADAAMSFFCVRRRAPALLLAACLALPVAQAQDDRVDSWDLLLRSSHHADGVRLSKLDDEDAALAELRPRHGRQLAYVDDEVRLRYRRGDWQFSALARSSGLLVTDGASLDLVQSVHEGRQPGGDRQWQAEARYRSFQGAGVELGRDFRPAERWRLGAALQLLGLRHLRQRDISGPVSYDARSGSYSVDLSSRQADDRLRFPFQQDFARRGTALLLSGSWRWSEAAWSVSGTLRDAGWLSWSGLPQQTMTLSTSTSDVDPDGFLIYKPLIAGRNQQQRFRRWNPPTVTVELQRDIGALGSLVLGAERIPGFGALPSLGWRGRLATFDLAANWRSHERRLDLTLGYGPFRLELGTDGAAARSRRLLVAACWPLR